MNGNLLLSIVVTFKKAFQTLLFYQKIRSQKYFAKKCAFALYFNVLVILVFYYLEFKLRLKMLNV